MKKKTNKTTKATKEIDLSRHFSKMAEVAEEAIALANSYAGNDSATADYLNDRYHKILDKLNKQLN